MKRMFMFNLTVGTLQSRGLEILQIVVFAQALLMLCLEHLYDKTFTF